MELLCFGEPGKFGECDHEPAAFVYVEGKDGPRAAGIACFCHVEIVELTLIRALARKDPDTDELLAEVTKAVIKLHVEVTKDASYSDRMN